MVKSGFFLEGNVNTACLFVLEFKICSLSLLYIAGFANDYVAFITGGKTFQKNLLFFLTLQEKSF